MSSLAAGCAEEGGEGLAGLTRRAGEERRVLLTEPECCDLAPAMAVHLGAARASRVFLPSLRRHVRRLDANTYNVKAFYVSRKSRLTIFSVRRITRIMMTTRETVELLRREAIARGDKTMVEMCDATLACLKAAEVNEAEQIDWGYVESNEVWS